MESFTEKIEAAAGRWNGQYFLKYRQLKDLIREMASGAERPRSRLGSADLMEVGETAVGCFQEQLQEELKKVNQFACVKHEDLFLSLRRLCEECKGLAGGGASVFAEVESKIEALGEEVVHLDGYVRLNYRGFQKLTESFDRHIGVSGSALFVAGLHCEPFCNVRFDDILILLGLAWARWRAAQSAEQSKDATWKPPESFIRNTAKYWVHPDKVALLKTRILRQLPYLIFGASQVDQEKLLDPFALLDLDYQGLEAQSAINAYAGALEESQLLSSVYFDSPDATCYQERIKREEGARLVRFRWYGENKLEPGKEIYVERKIHHEGWGSESSAKERCIIPQSEIFEFMKCRHDIEGYFARLAAEKVYSEKARRAMHGIATEVDNMIRVKKLQPILRTSYYRCAFQLATSNEVRISLDTQMTLLNEFRRDGHASPPWCHISSDLLAEDEVHRFPFAILEIKLQNVSETPLWLRQTLADIQAIQVHKFSKFQHGMAFLHPERVPILPHWHQDFVDWRERLRQQELAARQRPATRPLGSATSAMSNMDLTVPSLTTTVAPSGHGHLLKDMDVLDPKTVFANERTLLHYAEKGMYVGAAAVVLMRRQGAARIGGGVLAAGVALFYVWALWEYFSRLSRIYSRASVGKSSLLRLDWAHGPLLICAIVGLALVVSFSQAAVTLEARVP